MRKNLKFALYLFVFSLFSSAYAGSYDDFFKAIENDDAGKISALLQRGFDPNTVNPQGRYGLILALQASSLKVVDVLVQHKDLRVEVRSSHDETPLMLAALHGLTKICEKLIARGAEVNKPGWTALHYAATGGHLDIIQLLLRKHAYIDAASPNHSTPLMMAALYGSPEAVKMLLYAGADRTLKNDLGLTALEFAYKGQHAESQKLIATFVAGPSMGNASHSDTND